MFHKSNIISTSTWHNDSGFLVFKGEIIEGHPDNQVGVVLKNIANSVKSDDKGCFHYIIFNKYHFW